MDARRNTKHKYRNECTSEYETEISEWMHVGIQNGNIGMDARRNTKQKYRNGCTSEYRTEISEWMHIGIQNRNIGMDARRNTNENIEMDAHRNTKQKNRTIKSDCVVLKMLTLLKCAAPRDLRHLRCWRSPGVLVASHTSLRPPPQPYPPKVAGGPSPPLPTRETVNKTCPPTRAAGRNPTPVFPPPPPPQWWWWCPPRESPPP